MRLRISLFTYVILSALTVISSSTIQLAHAAQSKVTPTSSTVTKIEREGDNQACIEKVKPKSLSIFKDIKTSTEFKNIISSELSEADISYLKKRLLSQADLSQLQLLALLVRFVKTYENTKLEFSDYELQSICKHLIDSIYEKGLFTKRDRAIVLKVLNPIEWSEAALQSKLAKLSGGWLSYSSVAGILDSIFRLPIQDVLKKEERERFGESKGDPKGLWLGLSVEGLNTSYHEFVSLLKALNLPRGTVVSDMGSGFGRLGFVVGLAFPHLNFIGYEFLESRMKPGAESAAEIGLTNVKFRQADFSAPNFKAQGDVFHLYCPSSNFENMKKLMGKLQAVAKKKDILVVGARFICQGSIDDWLIEISDLYTAVTGQRPMRIYRPNSDFVADQASP